MLMRPQDCTHTGVVVRYKNTFLDLAWQEAPVARAASEPSRSRDSSPALAELRPQAQARLSAFLGDFEQAFKQQASTKDDQSTAPTEDMREDVSTADSLGSLLTPRNEQKLADVEPLPSKKKVKKKQRPKIAGSKRVFVAGLSNKTTNESLAAAFMVYGTVVGAEALCTLGTTRCRGYGFVTFLGDVPPGVLDHSHLIDGRRCTARPYAPR